MPANKVIKKKSTIEVPMSKQVSFDNDKSHHEKVPPFEVGVHGGYPARQRKSSPQQKTLRLEEDLFQAVKLVAKSLDLTEQDFIVNAIKKETNLHLAAAKERLTAQIASLPSIL